MQVFTFARRGLKKTPVRAINVKKPADLAKHITSDAKIKQFKAGQLVRVRKGKEMHHFFNADYKAKKAGHG